MNLEIKNYITIFVCIFAGIEFVILWSKKKRYPYIETIAVLFSLLTIKFVAFFKTTAGIQAFNAFVYKNRIFNFYISELFQIILLMVLVDFIYYWSHRLSHMVRIFWTTHSVHHLPLNLTILTSYQRSVFAQTISVFSILIIPVVFLGIEQKLMYYLIGLNLVYQSWLHNEFIGRLGFLEYFLNTPAQHRIHHSVLPEHANKNFGGILCIFDKIFGTYHLDQVETKTYGVLPEFKITNIFSPVVYEWNQWKNLLNEFMNTSGFKNKISVLIKV